MDQPLGATGQAGLEKQQDRGDPAQEDVQDRVQNPQQTGVSKTIVLFSDGTGNSSAKLFKTNLWRMYEAVDLGPDPNQGPTQIAFYDNGVGTSSFKLFAVIGGVFGWGLKRNILEIYRFLCRNYDQDRPELNTIHAFGFSRGAYTIRLVVALIGDQGIVPFTNERDLERQTADAYRAFRAKNGPNAFPWATIGVRAVRNAFIKLSRRIRGLPQFRPGKSGIPVRFLGVWDTVAAYGGPIAEITRGMDDWVWPLTMTDQKLGEHVETARHALALDDERDAFHPVLWDEIHERKIADEAAANEAKAGDPEEKEFHRLRKEKFANRIRQVWFSGMHADVGGGYPDESLSYVSLLWMMREAGAAGLRLLPDLVKRVQDLSTPFGPIHDSREGLAGYYRYQPRKIAAYMDPRGLRDEPTYSEARARKADAVFNATLSLRDPRIGEYLDRPQGLLMRCLVHESVIARIDSGTDGYAPISLPEKFAVVPPPAPPPLKGAVQRPDLVSGPVIANLEATSASRNERQETAWDFVFKRRIAYFSIVFLSFLIAATPIWVDADQSSLDGRSIWGVLVGWVGAVLPDLAAPWLQVLAASPFWIVIPGLLIWLVKRRSARSEAELRDRTRLIWSAALAGKAADVPAGSALRRFRNKKAYQITLQTVKWRILPVVFGWLTILAVILLLLVIAAQARLVRDERAEAICRTANPQTLADPGLVADPSRTVVAFDAALICNSTGLRVREGHRYRLTFLPHGRWADGGQPGTPAGIRTAEFPLLQQPYLWPATLLRRVVRAEWLQPLYEIRQVRGQGRAPLIYIDKLEFPQAERGRYVAEIEARSDGELLLFANEATLPWLPVSHFYSAGPDVANEGAARVIIEDMEPPEDTAPPDPVG